MLQFFRVVSDGHKITVPRRIGSELLRKLHADSQTATKTFAGSERKSNLVWEYRGNLNSLSPGNSVNVLGTRA